MSSIDVIALRDNDNGRGVWVRLPAVDPDTGKPTRAPRDARYRVRFRTTNGQSRTKTFDRRVDAERFVRGIDHSKDVGEFVDPMAGRTRFGDYAESWLERKAQTCKPSSMVTWRGQVNAHLRPRFGDVELRTITREDVKRFAGSLQPDVGPTTAQAIVLTLAAILREAVDDGRIPRNPAERLRVGKRGKGRVDPMHVGRIAGKVTAIADAMPPRWRAAVLLMASSGLRLGECLGLTTDRVDFLRRTIRVDRQLERVPGGSAFGSTKTRAAVRTIPVPAGVTDMLAAHLAEYGVGEHGLIFTSRGGGAVGRSQWSVHYRAACAAAEVDGRTRTHDLRHVAASSLIASGLSVPAVQAVLGHESAALTLGVYSHLWPTDEERTRDAIEAASAGWMAASSVAT